MENPSGNFQLIKAIKALKPGTGWKLGKSAIDFVRIDTLGMISWLSG